MEKIELQNHLRLQEVAGLNGIFYSSCFSDQIQEKFFTHRIKIECYQDSRQLLVRFQSYEDRMSDWGESLQSEIEEEIKSASSGRLADIEEIWIYPGLRNSANRSWSR